MRNDENTVAICNNQIYAELNFCGIFVELIFIFVELIFNLLLEFPLGQG